MQDSQLKHLLLETHPIRPGQEERAWNLLKGQLAAPARATRWEWLYLPSWRATGATVAAFAAIVTIGTIFGVGSSPLSYLSADSQSPGIYATAFYSKSAGAQVVWLNGMEPAGDHPTYLDPTTDTNKAPVEDPNSL